MQPELFDPITNRYRPVASQAAPRTYHNTAALLPSGEVLVGGHAPISTLYLNKRRSRAASRRTTAVTRRVSRKASYCSAAPE